MAAEPQAWGILQPLLSQPGLVMVTLHRMALDLRFRCEVEAWQKVWKIQSMNRMWTSADLAHAWDPRGRKGTASGQKPDYAGMVAFDSKIGQMVLQNSPRCMPLAVQSILP